jgi:hypothetical protein
MIKDVYDDDCLSVWACDCPDEDQDRFYHLQLLGRGITIDFTTEDWIEFLSSMRDLFYKKNEEE